MPPKPSCAALDRIKAQHRVTLLWHAHSIRSVLPRFFEGTLPDLNLGTNLGASCASGLSELLLQKAQQAAEDGYTSVLNGRFTGGYITRHYGQPAGHVHAVQLEVTQSSYMQEALPFDYLLEREVRAQEHLHMLLANHAGICVAPTRRL